MAATLEILDRPNGVRVLTLFNPVRKNALDDAFFDLLEQALRTPDGTRAILLRSKEEGIFSSGYDLASLKSYDPSQRLPDDRLGEVLDLITHHPAPSVAAVTGPAFGAGCELAAACDFRVGDGRALFSMPPSRLGVVYAQKGLARLVSRVGEGHARYMFLTGRRIGAAEALRFGLLDALAADGAAEDAALALCDELAASAPLALSGMKLGLSLMKRGGGTPAEAAHYEGLRRASFNSADAAEGRAAILEKRPPKFTGK